jgi:hypothetical protein
MSQLRRSINAARHWRWWWRLRAIVWSWLYDLSRGRLRAMQRETRGLVGMLEDADACPYEFEKPG